MDMSEYKLSIPVGQEKYIPRGNLSTDFKYFDLDSLVRLYGKVEVRRFLESSFPASYVAKLLETV